MKKLFIFIFALILCQVARAQYPVIQNLGNANSLVQVPANGGLKSLFINRPLADTTEANTTNIKYYPGAQFFASGDTAIWLRNSTATKWIQLFSNSSGSSGDTLVWKLSGNAVATRSVAPVLGTTTADNLNFITDGQQRMIIPSAGITRNGAAVNKYLLLDTITHNLYYGDGGGSGSTPNLLQVTAVDSVTSHKVGIGSITSNLIGRLHIQTNNLLNTPNDSSGLYLQNSTAATTTNRVQMSPSVVWEGYAWKNTGSLSQKHLWRADVLPVNSTVLTTSSRWRLSTSQAGGTYFNTFEVGAGFVNNYTSTGAYGVYNGIPLAIINTNNYNIGGAIPTTLTGSNNLAIGVLSLFSVTSGAYNTAVGIQALNADTSGGLNTAIGYFALHGNLSGEQNVAVGTNALLANTTGIKNTSVGAGSMEGNRTGGFNTGIGHDALLHVATGDQNVGLGWLAGSLDSTSSDNTSVGTSSARSMIGGSRNVMVGSQAGYNASQLVAANHSIGLGYGAYTRADYQFALSDSITRMKAQGMGRGVVGYALIDTTGNGDIALKSLATYGTNIYNSDGTLTGIRTLYGGGYQLEFNGQGTGNADLVMQNWDNYSFTNRSAASMGIQQDTIMLRPFRSQIAIDSLSQGSASDSLVVWNPSNGLVRKIDPARIAGNTIYTGDGTLAGNRSIDANNNNLIIDSTNTFTSTGRYFNFQAANTLGVSTIYNYIEELNRNNLLIRNFTGVDTSDILFDGYQGVSVSSTTAAYLSANRNADGSRSFAYVLPDSLKLYGDKGLSFYTGNGSAAQNRMVIDASGNVGMTSLAGTGSRAVLSDANGVLSAPISDKRAKSSISPVSDGLSKILALNPVTFYYKKEFQNFGTRQQIGFIAQDVQKVMPNSVFENQSGATKGLLGYSETDIIPLLVAGMQQQQAEIEKLKNEISKLRKRK